jgi:hypothetical protein
VANVARARYYQPQAAAWRDPVVTCGGDRLRFESFSGCCGVYARLDVLSEALDGEVFDRGTTNVDINGELREALARVGRSDPLHLSVGADELAVTTLDGAVVEKKVPLPERWLRGFAEVQVIASPFDLRAELSSVDATRFLRSLPTGRADLFWAVPAGSRCGCRAGPPGRGVPGRAVAAGGVASVAALRHGAAGVRAGRRPRLAAGGLGLGGGPARNAAGAHAVARVAARLLR